MRKKMKQQQATLAKAGLSSINAARGANADETNGADLDGSAEGGGGGGAGAPPRKRTLMDEMRERGIGSASSANAGAKNTAGKDDAEVDDYERFRAEMADLL